ncbi:MAG: NAD(P)/FAD-dependent oxidoreductase [Proteobacteria bacterium]|nr:NAD(P)/FAD-dependent oxidoreductase [Pseudomonadota bacterium]
MAEGKKIPDHVDVLIVGAGPAGLTAALSLARQQVNVAVVDARQKIGFPLRCGEITTEEYFSIIGIKPRPHWIRQKVEDTPGIIILNRELAEYEMAQTALKWGAYVAPGTTATKVGEFDGLGRRVTLVSEYGVRELHAGCIMASDGVSSCIARLAGINTHLSPHKIVSGLAYLLVDADLRYPQKVYIEPLEPPFPAYPYYFWVIPNGDRKANVGLYVPSIDGYKARELLNEKIAKTDAFGGGRIVQTVVGLIPDARPLKKPFSDGILVLGGAARLIDPLSAGGISMAMMSGKAAASTYIQTDGIPAVDTVLSPYRKKIDPIYTKIHAAWKKRRHIENGFKKGLPIDTQLGRKWAQHFN